MILIFTAIDALLLSNMCLRSHILPCSGKNVYITPPVSRFVFVQTHTCYQNNEM